MYVVKENRARYETLDMLSEGAMGTVVLARDHLLDRLVAIKSVKHSGRSDPDRQQRLVHALRTEAQVIQLLSHPNIVTVYDLLVDDPGQPPSLVMEYVQGSTLESYLKGGTPLPLDFVLPVVTQVAHALEHAHSMGVVHGDIKPGNILIAHEGEQAKLFDFGIATVLGDRATAGGRVLGTPRYVAPEILLGRKADRQSDLFSLGVVFYEMLTGHSPFRGETVEVVTRQIARGEADFSEPVRGAIPELLVPFLQRCLEPDPAARFASASDFLTALADPTQMERAGDLAATQDLTELVTPEISAADAEHSIPPAPPGADTDAGSRLAAAVRGTLYGLGSSRIRIGVTAGLTLLVASGVAYTTYTAVAPDGPPDARFPAEHKARIEVLPLLQESRRQLLAGEPEVATRILLRAEDLAPDPARIARLREEVERTARQREAERLAMQALDLDPENLEAQTLIDASRVRHPARSGNATDQRAADQPAAPGPSAEAPAGARPMISEPQVAATPSPPVQHTLQIEQRPAADPGVANLRVDVFSYLPKGVLTVYADQNQVLLQPFRFVQKSGFLRKKKTAGRLETSVEIPSGDTEFRIYISADGQETQTVNLTAGLTGGQTHVLRLIIAENGSASAQLN